MTVDFRSDNVLGASPEIVEALARASSGTMTSYGRDEMTARLVLRCREVFECDLDLFPVLTGTAGNALSIATLLAGDSVEDLGKTSHGAPLYCHEQAHILHDELGAPEFYARDARVVPVAGPNGKLDPVELERSITRDPGTRAHPGCLSVAQATEAGTVYRVGELAALGEVASRHRLAVHLDGARFANAVAALDCSPADLSWRAGADLLVLGGTKNGTFAAEVVVVFRRELRDRFAALWHRGGHRLSKMRFLSAQLEAYLQDDLWLRNARHANAAAAALAKAVSALPGVELLLPVEANVVFVRLPDAVVAAWRAADILFFDWPLLGERVYRLVTGFRTSQQDIDALVQAMSA